MTEPKLEATYPFYLANRSEQPNADLEVTDKYSGEVMSRLAVASEAEIDRATAAAVAAARPMDVSLRAAGYSGMHRRRFLSERAELCQRAAGADPRLTLCGVQAQVRGGG